MSQTFPRLHALQTVDLDIRDTLRNLDALRDERRTCEAEQTSERCDVLAGQIRAAEQTLREQWQRRSSLAQGVDTTLLDAYEQSLLNRHTL